MSKRILVVEDQPDNRQIIRDMLAPTDYEITEAENGEEALAAIAKQRPDLTLMDMSDQLLKRLRTWLNSFSVRRATALVARIALLEDGQDFGALPTHLS